MKIINNTNHSLCYNFEGPGNLEDMTSGTVCDGGPLIPGEIVEVNEDDVITLFIESRPERFKYVKNGYDVRTGEQVK